MFSIAVIVANRNNGRFLEQCLNSIIGQSLKPTEIVVADDASTDNSMDVLEPYVRDGVVALIRNSVQMGVAATRRLAIAQCSANYITTLDSDDFYIGRDKLAAEAEAIGTSARGRIAFSDVMRVDEMGNPLWLLSGNRKVREGDLSFHIRHLSGFIPRDYLVARVDYLHAGAYDPALRIYEDWDLKIRLSLQCSWHFSRALGTAYRINPKGLSSASFREHVVAMRAIFMKHCPERRQVARALAFARFFAYHSLYLRRLALA